MTGVPTRRWTASGLAQVANGEDAEPLLRSGLGQFLQVTDESRMAKKASPIAPHRLKARPLRREGNSTLHTASRIGPNSARGAWSRVNDVAPPLGQTLIWKHAPEDQCYEPQTLHICVNPR